MTNFQDGSEKSQLAFAHVPSEIGAYEAEEIGMCQGPGLRVLCTVEIEGVVTVSRRRVWCAQVWSTYFGM